MKCPVCDKENRTMLCSRCGFDSSRDYEKYPTLGPVGRVPTASALRQQRQVKQKPPEPVVPIRPVPIKPDPQPIPAPVKPARSVPAWLVAAACVVVLALGIWIGSGLGEKAAPTEPPETTTPPETTIPPETMTPPPETTAPPVTTVPSDAWKTNILRSDEIPKDRSGKDRVSAYTYSVFGSTYQREEISSISFLSTLSDAPQSAWDVSAEGDRSVLAWVKRDGSLYHLYIAGERGVSAGKSCREMFAGYSNVEKINFGDAFHTDHAEDMCRMFAYCRSLKSLELSSFDTANVEDMSRMFMSNEHLEYLNLEGFDTSKVEDMALMFAWCESLTNLDLSSFNTANVERMDSMFSWCKSLTDLDLSERFVATKAYNPYMYMFTDCPAGAEWGYLEN